MGAEGLAEDGTAEKVEQVRKSEMNQNGSVCDDLVSKSMAQHGSYGL